MEEVWKPVVGFEHLYEVSNLGNVRSISKYTTFKRLGKIMTRLKKGIVLGQKDNMFGYKEVTLYDNDSKKCTYKRVHRLVAEVFVDNPNNLPTVNHIDGDKKNNFWSNLEWNSHSQNTRHAVSSGLWKHYEGGDNRKFLTNEEVSWIRQNVVKGDRSFGLNALSKKFGVHVSTIAKIVKYERR